MTVTEKIRQFKQEGYKVVHTDAYKVVMVLPHGLTWARCIRIRTMESDFVTGDRCNGYGTHFTKI